MAQKIITVENFSEFLEANKAGSETDLRKFLDDTAAIITEEIETEKAGGAIQKADEPDFMIPGSS